MLSNSMLVLSKENLKNTMMHSELWYHALHEEMKQFNNENIVIKKRDNCQNSALWKSEFFKE